MDNNLIKISKKYLKSQYNFNIEEIFTYNFNIVLLITMFLILYLSSIELKSQIIINEICPINYKSLLDDDHSNEDWIELYNAADTAVNLKNYRIFDNNDYENAWVFPDTIIQPKSFLTIFASGKNRTSDNKFVMETSGEGLYYWVNPEGYSYAYTEIEGDFEAKVQITSFQNADFWANAGIMVREALDNSSRFIALTAREYTRNPEYFIKYRDTLNRRIKRIEYFSTRFIQYPEVYLHLKRVENSFIMNIIDIDGNILNSRSLDLNLSNKLYIGLSGNSKNKGKIANIYFKNFYINNIEQKYQNLNFIEFYTGQKGNFYINNTLHTNFKLNNEGEELYLWNDRQKILDSLNYGKLSYDVTFSKNQDNEIKLFGISEPTPNKLNSKIYLGITPKPNVNFENNIFKDNIDITIDLIENFDVRYTLNGENPINSSFLNNGESLTFFDNTILKVGAFNNEYLTSSFAYHTFIEKSNTKLPIISISTSNKDLFDPSEGILTNIKSIKEIIGNVEMFVNIDNNYKNVINTNIGLKLHGGISRTLSQKAFRFYFRDKYGDEKLNFNIFKENISYNDNTYNISRLLLKNGGQDFNSTKMRDNFGQNLAKNLEYINHLQNIPVKTYLNGNYNGLYYLTERFDDDYLNLKYNINKEEITIVEGNGNIVYGSNSIFNNQVQYLLNYENINNLTYSSIDSVLNVNNFIDYMFLNTLIMNYDFAFQNQLIWYQNNHKRLNFQPYDMDVCFSLWSNFKNNIFYDFLATENQIVNLFFKLTENDSIRNYFVTRVYDKLNTSFKSEKMIEIFDKMVDEIKDDIPAHQARFPESVPNWHQAVDSIRIFLRERPQFYKLHLSEYFQIHYEFRKVKVKLDTGYIDFNTIKLTTDFDGVYLVNQKLTLKLNLPFGMKLRHWLVNNKVYSNSEYIEIILTKDVEIVPVLFDEHNEKLPNIVINEIMHKSPDNIDSKDWIEFYNDEDVDIDLSNWQIYDDKETEEFIFPLEVKIKAKDYLVVSRNTKDFNKIYDSLGIVVNNKVGDLNFGLSADDQVRLFDNFKNLIDSVDYNISTPWPTNTFGEGWSLELISPELDNTQGENWQASYEFMGTPGRKNSIASSIRKDIKINSEYFSDNFNNILYPNPNYGEFTIDLSKLTTMKINQIKIYDLNNNLILSNSISEITLENTLNNHNIKLNNISKGIYTLHLLSNGYTKVITKFIIE